MTNNFASICPHALGRCNLTCLLTDVQVGRAIDINTALSQVHAALRVMRKMRKELFTDGKHLIRLLIHIRYSSSDPYVSTFTFHPAKCVTGHGPWWGLLPGHNQTSIQPAR